MGAGVVTFHPNPITVLSDVHRPIRINDRGDVMWTGLFYAPTIYINFIFSEQ